MAEKTYEEQLSRLREEQRKALEHTDDQICQWMKFRSDYEALKKRLWTLPDQVSHDVMVPFGKMAFMPGQLVHTNEILVLLGDNWFAERSAKQAANIVDRRIKSVDVQLEELRKQRQLLEPRQQFTSELQQLSQERGDVTEIREVYDEEKERTWKEAHRKHVREYKRRTKKEAEKRRTSQQLQETKTTSLTDEELWARLDQLENIESERRELLKVGTEAEKKLDGYMYPDFRHGVEEISNMKNLKIYDESDHSETDTEESSYTASDELDSDDDEEMVNKTNEGTEVTLDSKGRLISFSHSGNFGNLHTSKPDASTENPSDIGPGDIYTKYIKELKPKSILKKMPMEQKKKVRHKTKTPAVAFDTGSEDEQLRRQNVAPKPSTEPAFSAKVVEKSLSDFVPQSEKSTSDIVPQRPESKFKARSAKQNTDKKASLAESTNQGDGSSEKPISKFKAQRQMNKR